MKRLFAPLLVLIAVAGCMATAASSTAPANSTPAAKAPASAAPSPAPMSKQPAAGPVVAQATSKPDRMSAATKAGLSTRQVEMQQTQLNTELTKVFQDKKYKDYRNYDRAREILTALLLLDSEDGISWYNMACVDALTNHPDKAIECLAKSFEFGYADFRHMEQDTDLDSIRKTAPYKAFLANKDQVQRKRAVRIEQQLKKDMGSDYLIEIDDPDKLVFSTNIDRQTLDEVKVQLTEQAKALWKDMFDNRFEQYVTVVVLSEKDATKLPAYIGGYYNHATRQLIAKQIGMTLTHEFTHALHRADQDARGQEHPIWIMEGLAALAETSEIKKGHLVPLPNGRLNVLKQAIALSERYGGLTRPATAPTQPATASRPSGTQPATSSRPASGPRPPMRRAAVQGMVPIADFIKYTQPQYMQRAGICYGEGRYLMMYLYSKGVLRKWYDVYVKGFKDDPTGGKAMEQVLGKDLDGIQKDFVAYVKALPAVAERPTKGFMGVQTASAPDGLKVIGVVAGSGAADAGIKIGDVITKVDGARMADGDRLVAYIAQKDVGQSVEIEYRRDGKYLTAEIELKAVPTAMRPATVPAATAPAATPTPATKAAALPAPSASRKAA